jgi:hypothetical protein
VQYLDQIPTNCATDASIVHFDNFLLHAIRVLGKSIIVANISSVQLVLYCPIAWRKAGCIQLISIAHLPGSGAQVHRLHQPRQTAKNGHGHMRTLEHNLDRIMRNPIRSRE